MAEDWREFQVAGWAVKRVDLWRFLDCCPMELTACGAALNEEARASAGRKVLLGYSMGGRLALHALLQGGEWGAAVIVSAHPGLEDAEARRQRRACDAEWASRALSDEWDDFLRDWDAQSVLQSVGSRQAMGERRLLESRRRCVARSFIDWSLGAQAPLGPELGSLTKPLLWIVGERDRKFRKLLDELDRRPAGPAGRGMRPARLETWVAPGAGHRVPWESPEFATRVGEFLERVVS